MSRIAVTDATKGLLGRGRYGTGCRCLCDLLVGGLNCATRAVSDGEFVGPVGGRVPKLIGKDVSLGPAWAEAAVSTALCAAISA